MKWSSQPWALWLRALVLPIIVFGSLYPATGVALPDETQSFSQPAASLEARFSNHPGDTLVVTSLSGSYRFHPERNLKENRVFGKWLEEKFTRPKSTPTWNRWKPRAHPRGMVLIRGDQRRQVSLDGYRANGFVLRGDHLLVATLGGLYRLDRPKAEPIRVYEGRVLDITIKNDELYMLAPRRLIHQPLSNPTSYRFPGPIHNHITALLQADDQLVVGTLNHGYSRYDGTDWRHVGTDQAPGQVNSLAYFEDTLWVATSEGFHSDTSGDTTDRTPRWWLDPATDINVRDGYLSACGGATLGQVRHTGDEWNLLYADSQPYWQAVSRFQGDLVCGGMEGLGTLGTVELPDDTGLPDPWVTALLNHDGTLWIGTYDAGLAMYSPQTGLSMVDENVWVTPRSLAGKRGFVFAGSRGNGVKIYQNQRLVGQLTEENGVPGQEVTAVEPTKNGLWVGTRHGLSLIGWDTVNKQVPDEEVP